MSSGGMSSRTPEQAAARAGRGEPSECLRHDPSETGFSFLELLVATALLVVVTGAVFGLVDPATNTFGVQPELADMQQRLRVAIETVRRDLTMAGAGLHTGPPAGSLGQTIAPLVPHAVGPLLSGSPDRPDASVITITYVPPTPSQARLGAELRDGVAAAIEPVPGCPLGAASNVCGFEQGMRVAVFDARGSHDVLTVSSVEDGLLYLQPRNGALAHTYPAGSSIAEVSSVTYSLDRSQRRLYRYDGHRTNLPVVDDVVGLRFDYYADPVPPTLLKPVGDDEGPWTSYGPRPPPVGIDDPSDEWGAGENCVFLAVGGQHASRLPHLTGGSASGGPVLMPLTTLGDGPWCPGRVAAGGAPLGNRYDADLLRVRRVRVTVRVQVASASLRGPNPPGRALFAHPGSSRSGQRFVPDQQVQFEVAPRNMNLGR
jgi:hypothetical protein